MPVAALHAPLVLLPSGWARDVQISIGRSGKITAVSPGRSASGAERLAGPVVPAMPNLHSHAFQRAIAGLAEVAATGEDSFWTWREQMYRLVERLSPDDVEAITAAAYVDMLKSGYGSVAEFHYLHHAHDGAFYHDRAELSKRILAAANATGIGLTLLPAFYAHGNFGGQEPAPGQRRFIHNVDGFKQLMELLVPECAAAGATLGYAFHSLRATTHAEMSSLFADLNKQGPIHIHVAEQRKEVDDCLAWSGRRPVEWLLERMLVGARWCVIHATHADAGEVNQLGATGCVVGLCPTTEANLGDGIFPATTYRAAHGRFGIGSDSQVSLSVAEELRLLEYTQRLRDLRRARFGDFRNPSTGRALFEAALAGGAQALWQPIGQIAIGHFASLVVLDGAHPMLAAADGDAILDRWIFAVGNEAVRDVMVAGTWRIRERHHAAEESINRQFREALRRVT
jgi:formimidoylglutamate deiminase